MAFDQPPQGTSAVISGFLFLITLSGLELWAGKLASTPQLTILGGFVSSLLFFFALICVGNLERETKWFEVVCCLIVAMIAAATVHRVCVTTCFLFSMGLLVYMNYAARYINNSSPSLKKSS